MCIEFNREIYIGALHYVFGVGGVLDELDGQKADLSGADEVAEDVFVRDIPVVAETDAGRAARVCPVNAIAMYCDDRTSPHSVVILPL